MMDFGRHSWLLSSITRLFCGLRMTAAPVFGKVYVQKFKGNTKMTIFFFNEKKPLTQFGRTRPRLQLRAASEASCCTDRTANSVQSES